MIKMTSWLNQPEKGIVIEDLGPQPGDYTMKDLAKDLLPWVLKNLIKQRDEEAALAGGSCREIGQ